MNYRFLHNNLNVLDLNKSLDFYEKALGLREVSRKEAADGSFILVYLGYPGQVHQLELTWLADRTEPYDLGDNEIHLAFETDDYAGSLALHQEMGCVCFINDAMGIYFIEDPDGYWLEILPRR
ncbi:MAG: VOC family protein [Firmicutes bacterium]|nr:VOC family protein [Bacillota bacterium]